MEVVIKVFVSKKVDAVVVNTARKSFSTRLDNVVSHISFLRLRFYVTIIISHIRIFQTYVICFNSWNQAKVLVRKRRRKTNIARKYLVTAYFHYSDQLAIQINFSEAKKQFIYRSTSLVGPPHLQANLPNKTTLPKDSLTQKKRSLS